MSADEALDGKLRISSISTVASGLGSAARAGSAVAAEAEDDGEVVFVANVHERTDDLGGDRRPRLADDALEHVDRQRLGAFVLADAQLAPRDRGAFEFAFLREPDARGVERGESVHVFEPTQQLEAVGPRAVEQERHEAAQRAVLACTFAERARGLLGRETFAEFDESTGEHAMVTATFIEEIPDCKLRIDIARSPERAVRASAARAKYIKP